MQANANTCQKHPHAKQGDEYFGRHRGITDRAILHLATAGERGRVPLLLTFGVPQDDAGLFVKVCTVVVSRAPC